MLCVPKTNKSIFQQFRIYILDELPEEAHSAINHASSLRLFSLGAGHSQGIVHMTLLVQNDLLTRTTLL